MMASTNELNTNSRGMEPADKNTKRKPAKQRPALTLSTFLLSYGGFFILGLLTVLCFVAAGYLDMHGYPDHAYWCGFGASWCLVGATVWVWYFFNDSGGY